MGGHYLRISLMMALTFEQAVAGYCLFFVAFLLGSWTFWSHRTVRKTQEKFGRIWQCAVCTVVYTASEDEMMTECPRCGCLNKKGEDTADDD